MGLNSISDLVKYYDESETNCPTSLIVFPPLTPLWGRTKQLSLHSSFCFPELVKYRQIISIPQTQSSNDLSQYTLPPRQKVLIFQKETPL